MANRTVKDAKSVHGTNPQYLIEKIVRTRIYESRYWKEDCFALSAELVVDKGIELRFIGGTYGGNVKPSPFLCLTLKMLQIQPEKDIIIEFISQDSFKYVRALGAYYLRLTGSSLEVWKYLEPLYNDFRKLRLMDRMGKFSIIHMDEFVDMLLREDRVFDVILPRISKRRVHEEADELEPRVSALEDELDDVESEEEVVPKVEEPPPRERQTDRKRERSDRKTKGDEKPRETERSRDTEKSRNANEDRDRSSRDHRRKRSPDAEQESRRKSPPSRHRRSRSRERNRDYEKDPRDRSRRRDRSRTPERRRRD